MTATGSYDVLWPRGRKTVPDSPYGERLPSLAGKRIAELWNGGFRGDEIFPIVEEELSRRYPGVEFVSYKTFGLIHGTEERAIVAGLPAALKEQRIDAAIATSGC
jgi:hypothetical protein